MEAQSHLWLWQFGNYLRYGMLGSCICSTLVSVCAMKGIPIGPLAQWGKDLAYYLTLLFCLVNRDMHYPGSACRGTDLPSGRLLYLHICLHSAYDKNCPEFSNCSLSIDMRFSLIKHVSVSFNVSFAVSILLFYHRTSHGLPDHQTYHHLIFPVGIC